MKEDILDKVLSHIEQCIDQKIYLNELAELAGYSPFYFSKLFSEAMGMPVTSYIRIRKLQYAMVSLLEGKKVLEVSLMYAFDSHEGFTRAFTQLFGSTPSVVKKFLNSYQVPDYVLPTSNFRRNDMEIFDQKNVQNTIHQLVFEILEESIREAREGYCTKITITLLPDRKIKIADNGRGIRLTANTRADQEVLKKILDGHPITSLEYSQMGDFSQLGLQTVNSLCEMLQVTVYRDGKVFRQDYVRGIAQHELLCSASSHESGTEMVLKPDSEIFGSTVFSSDLIRDWVKNKDLNGLCVHIE